MPKFTCSYAYDIPHYLDFTVEAESEDEAQKKCEEALVNDSFDKVIDQAEACYSNHADDRVFVDGPAGEHCVPLTLEEILNPPKP
jgi:hypothetical protein